MAPYAAFHDAHVLSNPSADDLRDASEVSDLNSLTIFDYRLGLLDPIVCILGLESLKMQCSADIASFAPLVSLTGLRELIMSPPTSWDGSGRRIQVDSFRPLTRLAKLERLVLLSIRPRDLDIWPLAEMQQLKDLHVAGVDEFTIDHYARLAARLPNAGGRCLRPYVQIEGVGFCKRCKGRTVLLTGAPKRARKWLCPKCNEKKLAEHVRRWDELKSGL